MKKWFGRSLSLIAIFFVAYYIFNNSSQVRFSELHFHPGNFIVALIFAFSFFLLRILGYRLLLLKKRHTLSFRAVGHYLSSSELVRYIPGNIWGFVARVTNAEKYGITRTDASFLIIEESALLFLSAAVLSGIGLLCIPNLEFFWRALGFALIIAPVILLFLPSLLKAGHSFLARFVSNKLDSYFFPTATILRLFPLYITLWVSYGAAHYFFLASLLRVDAPASVMIFFSILAWLAGYASLITPSGLGVRELVMTASTAAYIPSAIAGLFSVISRLLFTLLEVIVYFLFWISYKRTSINLQNRT